MIACESLAWLQVVGVNEIRLLNPGRINQLAKELRDPVNQRPSTSLFVGRHAKDLALRELFPENNFKKGVYDGIATIRVDNTSTYSDNPIFFAESNPGQTIPLITEDSRFSETDSFPIQWADTITQLFSDIIHARLFCLFADVICVFADDFSDFDQVVHLLESWAAAGSASTYFHKVQPRVVIVRRGDETSPNPTCNLLEMENLQHGLHHRSIKEFFSSVKVLHLATEQLSPLARFRRLKEVLWRERDEMRLARQRLGCLYTAIHISEFFQTAVAHTAASCSRPFNFIVASRRDHKVPPDFSDHLSRFLRLGESHQTPQDALMTFIALSILLDAYPPKMHGKPPFLSLRLLERFNLRPTVFSPEAIYNVCYQQHCLQALAEVYGDWELVQRYNALIRDKLIALCSDMVGSGESAIQIHRDTTRSLDIDWTKFKINRTCLYCLRRPPENHLSCEHAICNVCVRRMGDETSLFDCQYQIETCLLCHKGNLLVGLRPLTAGLRILSVDGGGTRGVIAIEIINMLQSILGNVWRIQDMFDVAYGTSVGRSER